VTGLLLLLPALSVADDYQLVESKEAGLGVGFALVRFDTSVKFEDKKVNRSIFVSAEGDLDLPDWDSIPVFYGAYRFSKKHGIGFSYFQIKRESSIFDFDETLDEVHITGQATFSDDTRFYNLFYAHTLYEDERSHVQGNIGINVLDFRYVLEAQGSITYEDMTTSSSLREDTGITAPLPLFGFDFWYAFTPQWGINTKVALVGGSYQDIRGWVLTSNINARYQFSKHTGAILGIAYFDADITIEDESERTDVKYGYDGAFLGLHMVF
jgi:carbon monoxide dehydrogenase subunit G